MFICITNEWKFLPHTHKHTFCISFLKILSFKNFHINNKVFKRNKNNNNSLFCRCIFHEPQKAKWKGTIVHFSFNAQRSFETIKYYNITYWAKNGKNSAMNNVCILVLTVYYGVPTTWNFYYTVQYTHWSKNGKIVQEWLHDYFKF